MGRSRPATRCAAVNRAQRRRAGSRGAVLVAVEPLLMTVQQALDLNGARPIDGIGPLLYEIRADCGPDQLIEICGDCATVTVLV